MNLIVYVNDNFEDARALVDLDSDKVLVSGDQYHDKIDERIEGYLQALSDFGIYKGNTNNIPEEYIQEGHEYYERADFQ